MQDIYLTTLFQEISHLRILMQEQQTNFAIKQIAICKIYLKYGAELHILHLIELSRSFALRSLKRNLEMLIY